MEKAIEIKRRAQRCILSGDLDGALNEYEKLVASGDSDPYHFVLLADLLFKKGDQEHASRRYMEAVEGYEKSGLLKNAIAVCKKMSRLSFAPAAVLERLAQLHALDGLSTEASLYYMQHGDILQSQDSLERAGHSFQKAFQINKENVKALERLAETFHLGGEPDKASAALLDAAGQYDRQGLLAEAKRCRARAEFVNPGSVAPEEAPPIEPVDTPPVLAADTLPPPIARPAQLPVEPGEVTEEAAAFPRLQNLPAESADLAEPEPLSIHSSSLERQYAAAGAEEVAEIEEILEPTADLEGPTLGGAHDAGQDLPSYSAAAYGAIDLDHAMEESEPLGEPQAAAPSILPSAANGSMGLDIQRGHTSPAAPGLGFDAPAASPQEEAPAVSQSTDEETSLADVSGLLATAQEKFKSGDREGASLALLSAANTYDRAGRYDSAASIYRSLSQTSTGSLQLMMLWLKNCQRRADHHEAAHVACELGDRALNEGDLPGAQEWFERARAFDESNETAQRRLQRMAAVQSSGTPVAVATEPPVARPASHGNGSQPAARTSLLGSTPMPVDVQLDQSIPENVDLGVLIAEFQRSVSVELAGDAQSHYDLGMSYREMGLMEEAVESFRVAGRDPAFRVRSNEMLGRCLLDLGRFEEASLALRAAISEPGLAADASLSLRYQLGLALEAAGDSRAALREFEAVYTAAANYADVAVRMRGLRKSMELA